MFRQFLDLTQGLGRSLPVPRLPGFEEFFRAELALDGYLWHLAGRFNHEFSRSNLIDAKTGQAYSELTRYADVPGGAWVIRVLDLDPAATLLLLPAFSVECKKGCVCR